MPGGRAIANRSSHTRLAQAVSLLIITGVCLLPAPTATGGPVPEPFYFEDFEAPPGAEWNSATSEVSPSGQRYLGRFGSQEVTLTFSDLPEYEALELSFDLYVTGSMDGNSTADGPDILSFGVTSDAPTDLMTTTFSNVKSVPNYNQAYPNTYPGGDHPAGMGAVSTNTLGYPPTSNNPNVFFGDSTYHLTFPLENMGPDVVFSFEGQGVVAPNETPASDEGWALDNVTVVLTEPEPITHSRSVGLTLKKHLKATGSLEASDGYLPCVQAVPVDIQRKKKDGTWRSLKLLETDIEGTFKEAVGDKPGRYRVVAGEVLLDEGANICAEAVSPVRRHKHG